MGICMQAGIFTRGLTLQMAAKDEHRRLGGFGKRGFKTQKNRKLKSFVSKARFGENSGL